MENQLLQSPRSGKPMILGTDWHGDCDDVVAARILSWAHKNGVIRLLGVALDSTTELSYASVKGFLTYEGLTDIPIGLDPDASDERVSARYHKRLAELAPGSFPNSECENALHLYRRLLAESDEKVDIMEIGFSQVLAALLCSGADELSPLSGVELVRRKVNKLWIMGGCWNDFTFREYNFAHTERASRAIHTVLELCPVPITMLGFEVGETVISGEILKTHAPDDALYGVLCDWGAKDGRPSWDPMLVYLVCVGDEEKAGYRLIRGTASVDPKTGYNSFTEHADGRHGYVVKRFPDAEYARCIDEIVLAGAHRS